MQKCKFSLWCLALNAAPLSWGRFTSLVNPGEPHPGEWQESGRTALAHAQTSTGILPLPATGSLWCHTNVQIVDYPWSFYMFYVIYLNSLKIYIYVHPFLDLAWIYHFVTMNSHGKWMFSQSIKGNKTGAIHCMVLVSYTFVGCSLTKHLFISIGKPLHSSEGWRLFPLNLLTCSALVLHRRSVGSRAWFSKWSNGLCVCVPPDTIRVPRKPTPQRGILQRGSMS